MSDTPKSGPALNNTVHEVQGTFPSDAALQEGLSRLTLAGYDRAAFSLPEEQGTTTVTTPNESAENPVDRIDKAQLRTMGTSMATYAGAVAAAGATIATGGAAAIAVAAAAAIGIGGGVAANAAGQAADQAGVDLRNARAAEGKLILAVRTTTTAQADEVGSLLEQAGATKVEAIARTGDMLTTGVSAASWTGA